MYNEFLASTEGFMIFSDDVKRGFSLLNLCEQDNKIKEYIFENC